MPTSSGKVRGFTLIELMVVVVIIAVLAVIAVPLFSARFQGRRVFQAAGYFADLYRGSRTRALARGAAVMVTLNQTNYTMRVLEGVEGTPFATASGVGRQTCGNLPTRGCLTNNWGNVGTLTVIGTAREVETVGNQSIKTTYTVGSNAPEATKNLSICFSPAGRTYINDTGTWTPSAWQQLTDVIVIDVASTSPTTTPRSYKLVVLPNGTTRLAL